MRYLLTKAGAVMALPPEFEHISIDVIYLHLKRRVEQELEFYSVDQFPSSEEWGAVTTGVRAAYPGFKKTSEATRLCDELWRRWKLPTLFFSRSPDIIDERFANLEEQGQSGNYGRPGRCSRASARERSAGSSKG